MPLTNLGDSMCELINGNFGVRVFQSQNGEKGGFIKQN